MQTFRQETQVKYPSFAANPEPSHLSLDLKAPKPISPLKLAEAFSPIPIRHHYHHGDDTEPQQPSQQGLPNQPMFAGNNNPTYNTNPQSLTPAPTPPPPSPKPKKQQFQTDQTRPFLFPFSRSQVRGARGSQLVPYAIDEADKLYNKHMHISLSLLQMWQTREECMIEESGLQKIPGSELNFETFETVLSLNSHGRETASSFSTGTERSTGPEGDEQLEELPDITLLDTKLKEVERDISQLVGGRSQADVKKLRRLRERREDILRMKRVELIYVSNPILQFRLIVSDETCAGCGLAEPFGPGSCSVEDVTGNGFCQ